MDRQGAGLLPWGAGLGHRRGAHCVVGLGRVVEWKGGRRPDGEMIVERTGEAAAVLGVLAEAAAWADPGSRRGVWPLRGCKRAGLPPSAGSAGAPPASAVAPP